MIEIRLRTKISEELMEQMVGKMIQPSDIAATLTGPAKVLKPDGTPLCIYVPGAVSKKLRKESWPILHSMKGSYTNNRGMAAGTERLQGPSQRTYSKAVDSAIAGSFDPQGAKQFCRLSAWSRDNWEEWNGLFPLLEMVAKNLEKYVPSRYANQAREASRTAPEWVIPGTPFTTVTINNTYSTAVHTDKGDLDSGFSTLVVFRNGDYKGGWLCFPEYRLAVDMQDGDLLLMDAHEWHGNTPFDPEPARLPGGQLDGDPGFERISVVSYFRTKMVNCGSMEDENERRKVYAQNRAEALIGE